MKNFIKKIIKFLAFLLIIFVVCFSFFSNAHNLFKHDYNIENDISNIVIGDSHVQNSFNDNLAREYINFAHYAESFYFSYFKLKVILSSNLQVRRVFLGFSYHNLSNYYDDYISGKYSKSVSSEYFFILSFKEQINCMAWNKKELPLYMKMNFMNGFKKLKKEEKYIFSGGYYNHKIDTASILSIKKRIKAQFYNNGKLKGFSTINLAYLQHIIELCELKGIELILFNTPLHKNYKNNLPIEYVNKYNEIIRSSGLKFIDFTTLDMDDDCFQKDGDHVTEKGAFLMTNHFLENVN